LLVDLLIGMMIGCKNYEISFPFDVSEKALSIQSDYDFKIPVDENWEKKFEEISFKSVDLKYNNLKEKSYSNDNTILKEGCRCFTCTNSYTRAYIHHLLVCNEINATILLIM